MNRTSLPLIASEAAGLPSWHGWSVAPASAEAPEPSDPQGAYSALAAEAVLELPWLEEPLTPRPAELLAPAGGPEAAHAAFHYGADAVYLGLKNGIDPTRMIADLDRAQEGGFDFPAETYVNQFPARKHDHFLHAVVEHRQAWRAGRRLGEDLGRIDLQDPAVHLPIKGFQNL